MESGYMVLAEETKSHSCSDSDRGEERRGGSWQQQVKLFEAAAMVA
jgi:hypothetical protein